MWHPNGQQWRTLVIFVIAGVLGVLLGQRYGAFYASAAALIGGLLVWSQQTDRK